jgi:hypothetical protein
MADTRGLRFVLPEKLASEIGEEEKARDEEGDKNQGVFHFHSSSVHIFRLVINIWVLSLENKKITQPPTGEVVSSKLS